MHHAVIRAAHVSSQWRRVTEWGHREGLGMIRANDSGHYAAARRRVSPFGVARCWRYANRNSPLLMPSRGEPRKLLRNLGVCVLPFRAAYRCGQQSGKSQADRGENGEREIGASSAG